MPAGPSKLLGAAEGAGEDTFEFLYRTYREQVLRWALRYAGGDTGRAEDLAHDVFVKALEKLPGLDRPGDLGGWLHRVTAHLAVSRWRRERSLWSRIRHLFPEDEPASPPDQVLEARESSSAALQQLRALPAPERVVLCMKVLDGKSQREIADALELSEGYVSKLVARAWSRIRAAGWEVSNDSR